MQELNVNILTQNQQTNEDIDEIHSQIPFPKWKCAPPKLSADNKPWNATKTFLLQGPIVIAVASYRKRKRNQDRDRDPIFALQKGALEAISPTFHYILKRLVILRPQSIIDPQPTRDCSQDARLDLPIERG